MRRRTARRRTEGGRHADQRDTFPVFLPPPPPPPPPKKTLARLRHSGTCASDQAVNVERPLVLHIHLPKYDFPVYHHAKVRCKGSAQQVGRDVWPTKTLASLSARHDLPLPPNRAMTSGTRYQCRGQPRRWCSCKIPRPFASRPSKSSTFGWRVDTGRRPWIATSSPTRPCATSSTYGDVREAKSGGSRESGGGEGGEARLGRRVRRCRCPQAGRPVGSVVGSP